ncbi:MAG: GbsR/MarR family transcriptional regulator [Limisphaerales bacterium]
MTEIRSKARRDMVEASGRLYQLLGLPRSTGQIYGLLYFSAVPLSLDDLADLLGISKASASTGTRQLVSWGALRQVWVPGQRRDYFEIVPNLGAVIRASFDDFLKPRLTSTQKRFEQMKASLDEEFRLGILTGEEYKLCSERLKHLCHLQRKIQSVTPLVRRFF